MYKLLGFLLIAGLSLVDSHLVNPSEYVEKLAMRMVEIIENGQITGNSMPMENHQTFINATRYGLTVQGNVSFYSGFVPYIERARVRDTSHRNQITDDYSSMEAIFDLIGVRAFYDVTYDLIDYKKNGVFNFLFDDVAFDMRVERWHANQSIKATITFTGTQRSRDRKMEMQAYPADPHAQLVARQMKLDANIRLPIEDSFKKWSAIWQEALNQAVKEIAYPSIDYYCD